MKITESKVLRDLEALRVAAMEGKGFAPALRAIELMGRHIGMWRDAGAREQTLAELIAGVPERDEEGKDGG